MKTIVEKITKEQLNTEEGKKIIGQAGDFLKEGGLVAFPTETVYGLGTDGSSYFMFCKELTDRTACKYHQKVL